MPLAGGPQASVQTQWAVVEKTLQAVTRRPLTDLPGNGVETWVQSSHL